MKALRACLLCLFLLTDLSGSLSVAAEQPSFESFAVPVAAIRKSVPPDFRSALAKRYKTVIARSAAAGPNFSGHYTFVSWGCGTACQEFAIVDATTGRIHFPAFRLNAYHAVTDGTEPFRYRLDSALLIIAGAPGDGDDVGVFHYRWTGKDLQLIKYEKRHWPR